jgi:SRSO17 transposase
VGAHCSLPPTTPLLTLVRIARSRWAIEEQDCDLKSDWGSITSKAAAIEGWNHHAVLAALDVHLPAARTTAPHQSAPTFPEIRDLMREVMAEHSSG